MEFTKIAKGEYIFKGIDSWTGNEIQGHIIKVNYDCPISKSWHVVFGLDSKCADRPYMGKSLKDCKKWLTD